MIISSFRRKIGAIAAISHPISQQPKVYFSSLKLIILSSANFWTDYTLCEKVFFKVNFNPKLPSSPLCFLFFNPSLLLSELAWCSESQGSWVLIQRGRQRKWLFGTLYYSHHSKVLIDAEVHYSQKISGYHGIHVGITALIFWMLPVLKLTRYLSASRYRECVNGL